MGFCEDAFASHLGISGVGHVVTDGTTSDGFRPVTFFCYLSGVSQMFFFS